MSTTCTRCNLHTLRSDGTCGAYDHNRVLCRPGCPGYDRQGRCWCKCHAKHRPSEEE